MKVLNLEVHTSSNYSIFIEKGILHKLEQFKDCFFKYDKVVIITDDNVAPLYLKNVSKQLEHLGCKTHSIVVKAGEKSKNLQQVEEIYHHFLEYNITRSDLIIALGGGVIGDLTGFCASTYLRGIDFIQIPTTLLAQVDSSVGGKVGVNLSKGKNLVGSFYQPKLVIIDPNTLNTLENRRFADGMAEVIKYGCIFDKGLFNKLMKYTYEDLIENIEEVIHDCCRIKKDVVQQDEKEKGIRRLLNFGHTIGHVIEAYYKYSKYTHGESVAIGMYHFSKIGEEKGITKIGVSNKVKDILTKYKLPHIMPNLETNDVLEIISKDKKFDGENINLIFIEAIGVPSIIKINKLQLKEYI